MDALNLQHLTDNLYDMSEAVTFIFIVQGSQSVAKYSSQKN